jgi:hypothetical protein
MRRILFALASAFSLALVLAPACAHATVCALASGASQATVQGAITAASTAACTGTASASTVQFGAGAYTFTSAVTIPCGSAAMTLTGPVVTFPAAATATIAGTFSVSSLFSVAACTTGLTFEYLGCNGGVPSPHGGSCMFVAGPFSNLTFMHNTVWGNQGSTTAAGPADSLLWLDGTKPAVVDANITVTWNSFGATGNCSNVMTVLADSGGYCAGMGLHPAFSNLVVENNRFFYQEQGVKLWE